MLSDLGARLAAAGHEVTAICSDRSYAQPKLRYPLREVIDGVRVRRVPTTAFGRRSKVGRAADYSAFLFGAAFRLLFGTRVDSVVVLTTPPMVAAIPLLVSRLRHFRVVFWSMDVYPELAFRLEAVRRESFGGRILSRIAEWILRSADVTIALGDSMAGLLRKAGAQNVEVVHNWADETAIVPMKPTERSSRAEWGWTRRFVLLYSGNLGLAHEFETVIAAARRLSSEMPNILFAFIGVGPRLNEVRQATRDLSNVEFRDFVPRAKLGESLAAADVHVVTLRPGMAGLLVPSKIYGILAAGRPTIYVGPAEGEIHDIVTTGRCGASIRNQDVDGLVGAIRDYACDPFRRDREGESARSTFERNYTKELSLSALQRVIEHRSAAEVSASSNRGGNGIRD
jgi:glycosyltransferase involved in cell wall biosynthesis